MATITITTTAKIESSNLAFENAMRQGNATAITSNYTQTHRTHPAAQQPVDNGQTGEFRPTGSR